MCSHSLHINFYVYSQFWQFYRLRPRAMVSALWQVSLRTSSAGQSPTLCISWFFISQDILWFLIHLGAIWVRCVTKQISMAGFKYQKIFVYTAGIPPYVCQLACSLSLYFKEKWNEGLHVLFLCSFACGVVKSPSLFLTRPITLAEGGIFQRKIAPTNDTETTLWHKSKLAKWFGILYFTWAMSMQLFP